MNEFSLIDQYFKSIVTKRSDVILGIGDDAACLKIPAGMQVVVSTDTLVSGVHFLPEWNAYDIACKAVLVNVSDIAAMAAEPCWVTLALTLPEINEQWLASFSHGLKDSLNQFGIDLIGGDTTRGPLAMTLTIMGLVRQDKIVTRAGAQAGEVILVSGQLGAASLAVHFLQKKDLPQEDKAELMNKLLHPNPRVDLRLFLAKYASAAIDISDGLSADLNHICVASGIGACLLEEALPINPLLFKYLGDRAVDLALRGGDDYELCFTVPSFKVDTLLAELKAIGLVCYPIGLVEEKPGLRIQKADNKYYELSPDGYQHF